MPHPLTLTNQQGTSSNILFYDENLFRSQEKETLSSQIDPLDYSSQHLRGRVHLPDPNQLVQSKSLATVIGERLQPIVEKFTGRHLRGASSEEVILEKSLVSLLSSQRFEPDRFMLQLGHHLVYSPKECEGFLNRHMQNEDLLTRLCSWNKRHPRKLLIREFPSRHISFILPTFVDTVYPTHIILPPVGVEKGVIAIFNGSAWTVLEASKEDLQLIEKLARIDPKVLKKLSEVEITLLDWNKKSST